MFKQLHNWWVSFIFCHSCNHYLAGSQKCPVVELSCQASIERQMFSASPTLSATPPPSSLNAACMGQLGNERLLYLIFLGKGMVGSGGFKRKAPNCNEMNQASRQGRLPSRGNDWPQPSTVLSFVVVLHPAL